MKDTILEAGRQFTSRWRQGKDYRSLLILAFLEHGSDKSASSTQVASPLFHPLTAGSRKAAHNFQRFDLINNSLFNDDLLCILALFRKKNEAVLHDRTIPKNWFCYQFKQKPSSLQRLYNYRQGDMAKGLKSIKDIRQYWDSEAELGPDRSVIDQNDKKGNKIKYITRLRDRAVLSELSDIATSSRILDLGCGSGNLSKTLDNQGFCVSGADISLKILRYTQRQKFSQPSVFAQYDGKCLPFSANCFDACVISGVLCYLNDADSLLQLLKEVSRVLKPGGRLVAVEQTRRTRKYQQNKMKLQRPATEILQTLAEAGLVTKRHQIIRRGHFLLIYPIRYGLIPPPFFPYIGKIEVFFGRCFSRPLFDYADTVFMAEKLRQANREKPICEGERG